MLIPLRLVVPVDGDGRYRGCAARGGLSMLLGVYPVIGIVLLIIFLVGVSFQMHSFWKMDDAQMKQIDMINFTKNMALIGALLMFLVLPHPWPTSLRIG
jgi:putative oxidoreductase